MYRRALLYLRVPLAQPGLLAEVEAHQLRDRLAQDPIHGAIAGEMLKPYVADEIYHAIVHHQDFQGRYYYEHLGKDPNAREKYRGEPWFEMAEKIVDRWDAPAFDPDYDVDSLESFEPEIRRVFAAPKRGI